MKPVFFDTNVLVYAVDLAAGGRGERARQLVTAALRDRSAVVSTQVLQEFYVVATRKLGIEAAVARRQVELLSTLEVVPITVALILEAIDLRRLRQVSFGDALVLRAAAAAGCATLWSEDLPAGAVFDGVRVENPLT